MAPGVNVILRKTKNKRGCFHIQLRNINKLRKGKILNKQEEVMKIFNFTVCMFFIITLAFGFSGIPTLVCAGETHLYIMPHGDDIIQISAKIYDDLHLTSPLAAKIDDDHHSISPPEIHILFTGNDANSVENATALLSAYLGIDPQNVHRVSRYGTINHKKAIMKVIKQMLVDLAPDKVFIQGWCGSHPEHEMNHIEVVMAAVLAEKQTGVAVQIYEFPTFTGAYGRLPSDATIEERSNYWNSLIDLNGKYHTWNETIPVYESQAALQAKEDLIKNWNIGWMQELIGQYSEEDFRYFISQEKYRLLGNYQYLHRPYPGPMSYEFLHEWPYVFEDLKHYTLTLGERYGADLWTDPVATCKKKHIFIYPQYVYHGLKVCLENTSSENDVFNISAAWDERRIPAAVDAVGFDSSSLSLEGGQMACVNGWIDAHDISGYHVLWIKAQSENAFLNSSHPDYTEIPFVIYVNEIDEVDKLQKSVPHSD
jgi:hypothetical protein